MSSGFLPDKHWRKNMEIKAIKFEELDPVVDDILMSHIEEKTGLSVEEKRKFAFALVVDEKIIGGITAKMNFNRCHITGLGIKKEFRSGGYGKALLEKAEKTAIEIGAKLITLSTQDFQAREFYEKLGYTVFGTLVDCPFDGTTKYYMSKRVD